MEIKHIADLTPDPKNARRHNPRNIGVIERSLGEVGAARSIVIDENGVILAGNATTEAAAAAGITRVQVVDADGDTIIAVRRRGLTDEQKIKLALADNRANELSDWEPGVLADLAGGMDLSGLFYPHELAEVAQLDAAPVDPAELWRGMPEFEQEDQESWKAIKVHFANKDDYEAFARLVGQTLTDKTKYVWYPFKEKFDHLDYEADDQS